MTSRKKPGVAFWATVVVVVVLVGYPLSIGPVLWLADRQMIPDAAKKQVGLIYAPLAWVVNNSSNAFQVYSWYGRLWKRARDPDL
jgi:hypothetical protein